MKKAMGPSKLLPTTPIPLEYATYKHSAYEIQGSYIVGSWNDAPVLFDEMIDIHARFNQMYRQQDGSFLLSKHEIREEIFKKAHGKAKEVVSLTSGRELIADLLELPCATIWNLSDEEERNTLNNAAILCEKYGILQWQFEKVKTSHEVQIKFSQGYDSYIAERFGLNHDKCKPRPDIQDFLRFAFGNMDFYSNLHLLKMLYLSWRLLFLSPISDEDKSELLMLLRVNWKRLNIQNAPKPNSVSIVDIEQIILQISSMNASLRKVAFMNGKPIIVYQYSDPIKAAIGTMLQIISQGQDGTENRSIAKCEYCENTFIKDHGLQKYCEPCRKPRIQMKILREKRKSEKEKEA